MVIAEDILSLIPQRPPFVMVDALAECNETAAKTNFLVKEGNLFLNKGILGEPALIENIAQTAAARIGYICRQKNEPVPVGFIGAVQQLEIFSQPMAGDRLETTIEIKNQVFNATIITGNIYSSGKQVATCEMKIFINQ
jgi:predicted hotdog family 3-hydroxylacyl-ACP dehydratase